MLDIGLAAAAYTCAVLLGQFMKGAFVAEMLA